MCSDALRMLSGTWCTPEINLAVEKGTVFVIIKQKNFKKNRTKKQHQHSLPLMCIVFIHYVLFFFILLHSIIITMKKLALFLSFLFVISCSKDPIIYTLTTSANPAEGGMVSPSTQQFEEGQTATITASPSSDYLFQSWSGATGSSNSTSVVMNSDKTVTANFVKKKYALTTTVEGEGTVTEKVIKAGAATDYNSGTIVELKTIPSGEW